MTSDVLPVQSTDTLPVTDNYVSHSTDSCMMFRTVIVLRGYQEASRKPMSSSATRIFSTTVHGTE